MNRLNEWKRRINATQLSDDDKQKACDGLDRIWATEEGEFESEPERFANLFLWADTVEGAAFWSNVHTSLCDRNLDILPKPLVESTAIQQLIDAAKRYKKLRDLAERAEKEI